MGPEVGGLSAKPSCGRAIILVKQCPSSERIRPDYSNCKQPSAATRCATLNTTEDQRLNTFFWSFKNRLNRGDIKFLIYCVIRLSSILRCPIKYQVCLVSYPKSHFNLWYQALDTQTGHKMATGRGHKVHITQKFLHLHHLILLS